MRFSQVLCNQTGLRTARDRTDEPAGAVRFPDSRGNPASLSAR